MILYHYNKEVGKYEAEHKNVVKKGFVKISTGAAICRAIQKAGIN